MRSTTRFAAVTLAALAGSALGQNLITNPGFESFDPFLGTIDNWQRLGNTGGGLVFNPVRSGSTAVSVVSAPGFNSWARTNASIVPLPNGGEVTFSGWYNVPGNITGTDVTGVKLEWRRTDSNGNFVPNDQTGDLVISDVDFTTGGQWTPFSFVIPLTDVPAGTTGTQVQLFTFDGSAATPPSGTIFFDDISITQADDCGPADFVRDGVLNIFDIFEFFNQFASGGGGDPTLNLVPNPSFESSELRDVAGVPTAFPVDWAKINNLGGGYDTSNLAGAPAARTGTRLVSVNGEIPRANNNVDGFNSWGLNRASTNVFTLNTEGQIRWEFFYNVPAQNPAFFTGLFAAKLEWLGDNGTGGFRVIGSTGDVIIATDLSPTGGWAPFLFVVEGTDVPPATVGVDVLLFTFDPDQPAGSGRQRGKAYFDDVSVKQEASAGPADLNNDGVTNIFDIFVFFNLFGAGC